MKPAPAPARPGIRYFAPNGDRLQFLADPVRQIEALGIAEQFGTNRNGLNINGVAGGPGGLRGVIISREPVPATYAPDQKWEEHPLQLASEECPEPKTVWIHLFSDPGPIHLQRDEIIDGHGIRLGDGNVWTVPVLRSAEGIIQLPKRLRLGKGGQLVGAVAPKYVALWEEAQVVWNLLTSGEGVPFGKLWPFACRVLGLNYRVGQPEVSAMGLIDSDNIVKVAEAALDVPSMKILQEDAQKKSPEPVS